MPGCKQFALRGVLGRSCTGSVNRLLMQWLVHQVVHARTEEGFRSWARWTREDPSSHPQQMATTRNGSARSKTYLQSYSNGGHPLQPKAIRASTLEDGPAASLSSTTKPNQQAYASAASKTQQESSWACAEPRQLALKAKQRASV